MTIYRGGLGLTVFFFAKPTRQFSLEILKIDRLISIVVETKKNWAAPNVTPPR